MCAILSVIFSIDNTKITFIPWKIWWIKWSKYWFCACVDTFDWYLLQLIVHVNLDFSCSSRFVLSWICKVTTGTQRFISATANVPASVGLVTTQFTDQFETRLVSYLFKYIHEFSRNYSSILTLFGMGFFRADQGLKSVTHILQW